MLFTNSNCLTVLRNSLKPTPFVSTKKVVSYFFSTNTAISTSLFLSATHQNLPYSPSLPLTKSFFILLTLTRFILHDFNSTIVPRHSSKPTYVIHPCPLQNSLWTKRSHTASHPCFIKRPLFTTT